MENRFGNESVLAALSETVGAVPSVDLRPVAETVLSEDALAATTPHTEDAGEVELPRQESPPTKRYVALQELGRGGLGVVLEAQDRDLRRSVALKRPRGDRMGGSAVGRLVREAQITAQLDHPNIPAVHTLGIDEDGRPFFTMTFVRGESLAELLGRRHVDPEVARMLTHGRLMRIFLQVCSAVAYAHQRGVLHRDLKPENVMIGAFGEVRLMDWGVAKIIDVDDDEAIDSELGEAPPAVQVDDAARTKQGAIVGTVVYAPPEQLQGAKDLDERADVYALGALAYAMLAGRPPIVADSVMDAVTKAVQGDIPPLTQETAVDPALAAIVHKALALERDDRYTDVPELIADVEALLEGRTVAAFEECPIHRIGRFYTKRSHRLTRLRFLEIDLLAWGAFLMGLGCAPLVEGIADGLFWLLFFVGVAFTVPFWYQLARKPRPEDPGMLYPYSGGSSVATTSRSGHTRLPPG